MGADSSTFEALLARDRFWASLGLGTAVLLCWAWLVPTAIDMQGNMLGLAAWMMTAHWDERYAALIFGMWAVMMIGMMLPSAAPALLIFARVVRSDESVTAPLLRVYIFAGGYALAWCGFSLLATFAQWALAQATLLTPMMRLHSAAFGAALLVLAGAYQWAPLKRSCLSQCRSPVAFFAAHWRPNVAGAMYMGFHHGLYCLGCCWALMLLLFVGGVMSLGWIAALAIAVLLEKLAPFGVVAGKLSGALLMLAGAAIGAEALVSD